MAMECQGCGDLHGHCPVWIELTPDVLQSIADQESLKRVVAEVIDTMTTSSMGLSDHALGWVIDIIGLCGKIIMTGSTLLLNLTCW
jgi:hypothetical protein